MASAFTDRYFSIFISSHRLCPSTLYTHFQKAEIKRRSWIPSTSVDRWVIHHGLIDFSIASLFWELQKLSIPKTFDLKASLGWKAAVKQSGKCKYFCGGFHLFWFCLLGLVWFSLWPDLTVAEQTTHKPPFIFTKNSQNIYLKSSIKICILWSNNLIIFSGFQVKLWYVQCSKTEY